MTNVLAASGVRKVFRGGDGSLLEVLNHVDLEVRRGEIVAIVGASGSGKSTLLHILGALDEPSGGNLSLDGVDYGDMDEAARCLLRSRSIGFVFQFHHLLREFSALENVMMPLLIAGVAQSAARNKAEEILATVGLAGRMTHRPTELSGGEQQRCAVARALVHDPKVLLADEPTGNLDFLNGMQIADMFFDLARELETSVVIVSHNRSLVQRADRVLLLQNGRLHPTSAEEMAHG
ncbi:MAG: ABC transporter ATP-binding protein [Gemmatimonadales bacterium]